MQPIGFECALDIHKAYEDGGRWIVEGLAATSDFDLQEDIITRQAIENSARDLIENSTVLHNHNPNEAIGKVERSEAKDGGLWLKILVSKTVPDTWQKIKEGVLNKFSIRGKILEAKKQWVPRLGRYARLIFKMHLLEVSLVAVPANPKARAIRWYIEKALSEYEENGGEIEEMENPEKAKEKGDMDMEIEVIEEELVEAVGETENAEPQETEKAETPKRALFLLDKLLAGEKDEKRKEMLEEIKTLLSTTEKGCPCKEAGKDDEAELEKAGRKISGSRLSRLRKLLSELEEIIAEAEPQREEKKSLEHDDELVKKLGSLEEAMAKITKALGMAEPDDKDDGEPTLAGTIERLSKRLDAIEGIPAIKTSIDGQEPLAGEGKGKSIWKGLV
jgi:HK97 family phage prohead protease